MVMNIKLLIDGYTYIYNILSYRNSMLSIKQNLERLLSTTLPSRPDITDTSFNGYECGICYAYWLHTNSDNDIQQSHRQMPDTTCRNADCSKPFHRLCLIEVS
jgi:hypothetical protein